jgi:hypothetical protein
VSITPAPKRVKREKKKPTNANHPAGASDESLLRPTFKSAYLQFLANQEADDLKGDRHGKSTKASSSTAPEPGIANERACLQDDESDPGDC